VLPGSDIASLNSRQRPRYQRDEDRHREGDRPDIQLGPRRAQLERDILQLATQQNCERGYHVTEQELVAQFGVSRSPVPAALKVLEEPGILQEQRNQSACHALDRDNFSSSGDRA
jgi:DNA-binding GntR family transcriptional regulator